MKFILLATLITLILADQYVPIPGKPLGYEVNGDSQLKIEVFYDLICPDSKNYFGILDNIVKEMSDQFQYIIHIYPLPYHIAAYTGAQGFRYLSDNVPGKAAYEFARAMYNHLDELTNTANIDNTHEQLIQKLAQIAADEVYPQYEYDQALFLRSMYPNTLENIKVRHELKYAVHRGISGTPIFMANSVVIDGAEKFTEQEWKDFINTMNPVAQQEL